MGTSGLRLSALTSSSTAIVLLILLMATDLSLSQTYEDAKAIFDDKLSSSVYHTEVRPLDNQSLPIDVGVFLELVSIVGVDDVSQKFLSNAFLGLAWRDEVSWFRFGQGGASIDMFGQLQARLICDKQRLSWDPAQYGGQFQIHPQTKKIWKPRVILLNTLEDRDVFEDDHAPLSVNSDGFVFWAPGSVFPTSCSLDMTNYPYDEQTCTIQFVSMGLGITELTFTPHTGEVGKTFFIENGEWELKDATIEARAFALSEAVVPSIEVKFHLKRRPMFLMMNILAPVMLLSFLNILVFIIPVESGEKVSYGITVLLALAVFLSIVSGMLPRSSDKVPKITIYLCILLVVSVLTVIDSIIVVFFAHLEQEEEKSIKAQDHFQTAFRKVRLMNRSVTSLQENSSLKNLGGYKMEDPLSFADRGQRLNNIGRPATTLGVNMPGFRRSSIDMHSLPSYEDDSRKLRKTQEMDYPEGDGKKPRRNKYKIISKHIDKVSFVAFFLVWLCVTLGFLLDICS